jgi:hypothetical protein
MRFGATFPTKRKKYGTAKQLNARRTRPTNKPGCGLSIKRHFQPSFGSAAESEMRRHAEISPMPLLILLLRQGCHQRKRLLILGLKYIGRGAEVTATLISLKIYTRLSVCAVFFRSPLTVKLRKFAALQQKL